METTILKLGLLLGMLFVPLSAWVSPRLVLWLRTRQHIRPEGPSTHGKKVGTPTMGGLVPLSLVLGGAGILWALKGLSWPTGFAVSSAVLGGVIGLLDDLRSQKGRRSSGFSPHQTLILQFGASLLLLLLATRFPQAFRLPFSSTSVSLPFWVWAPLLVLAYLGTVNGVNLADGLDGLAIGLFLLAVLGFLPFLIRDAGLGALSFLVLGAGLGFLWANAHPARVFLGNVGSMGLGGLLFGLGWSSGGILLLPLVGGVFVLEVLSDILQVASYKLRGVRFLKMSPFHHHLEDVPVSWPHRLRSPNWPEPKVVTRLWIAGAVCALLGVLATL